MQPNAILAKPAHLAPQYGAQFEDESIAAAYHAVAEPMLSREEAQSEVRAGIESLMRKRIVEAVNRRAGKRAPSNRRAEHEHKARP